MFTLSKVGTRFVQAIMIFLMAIGPCLLFTKNMAAKIPTKIKITSWKFLKNYNPTASILHARIIASSLICPRCCQCSESPLHVLLWYGPTQEVWVKMGFSWPIDVS